MEGTTWEATLWERKFGNILKGMIHENKEAFEVLKDDPQATKNLSFELLVKALTQSENSLTKTLTDNSN